MKQTNKMEIRRDKTYKLKVDNNKMYFFINFVFPAHPQHTHSLRVGEQLVSENNHVEQTSRIRLR